LAGGWEAEGTVEERVEVESVRGLVDELVIKVEVEVRFTDELDLETMHVPNAD
jgi:urease gamma subunit